MSTHAISALLLRREVLVCFVDPTPGLSETCEHGLWSEEVSVMLLWFLEVREEAVSSSRLMI